MRTESEKGQPLILAGECGHWQSEGPLGTDLLQSGSGLLVLGLLDPSYSLSLTLSNTTDHKHVHAKAPGNPKKELDTLRIRV